MMTIPILSLTLFFLSTTTTTLVQGQSGTRTRYVASIQTDGGRGSTIGSIAFECEGTDGMVHVTGTVNQLTRSETGMNGIHIHELGDMSNGCESVGPHFNPTRSNHGAQTDSMRHAGDLGNMVIDSSGTGTIDLYDNHIYLEGENSILGRSIVIHANEDDLGQGGDEGSRTTGNSGGRIACGVIGLAASSSSSSSS